LVTTDKKAPESCDSGAKLWWALAARSGRYTPLGALAFAGRVLPDATPRGKAKVSVSWRDRPNRCRLGALSEAFSPGSVVPCRERPAGRGAGTPASVASCRHRGREDGTGWSPAVGPALRVWPLTSQAGFTLQLGDAVCRAAQSRSFPGFAHARSLPATAIALRARPVCRKGLLAGVARRLSPSRSGLRSSSHYPLGNCVG